MKDIIVSKIVELWKFSFFQLIWYYLTFLKSIFLTISILKTLSTNLFYLRYFFYFPKETRYRIRQGMSDNRN